MTRSPFKSDSPSLALPAHDPRIVQVIRALQGQPQLAPKQLAAMVALSPSHLRHLFRKQTGTSITAFSRELQLARARELLVTTHRALKEIRNEIGISDPSNFVRYFRKRFGVTPSAYRKVAIAVLTNE